LIKIVTGGQILRLSVVVVVYLRPSGRMAEGEPRPYVHTYVHAYIRTHIHMYVHTKIHTYIHKYIDT